MSLQICSKVLSRWNLIDTNWARIVDFSRHHISPSAHKYLIPQSQKGEPSPKFISEISGMNERGDYIITVESTQGSPIP